VIDDRHDTSFTALCRGPLRTAPLGILIVGWDGLISDVNDTAATLFGYAPEELRGVPVERLVPERLRTDHTAHRAASGAIDRPMGRGRVVRGLHRDGRELTVEVGLAAVEIAGERAHLVFAADVTEQTRVQSELSAADRVITVGVLAAGMAHELNNPLAAIIGNLELAADDLARAGAAAPFDVADLRAQIADAREAAERMRVILADLRLFKRPQRHALHPVDVRQVLEATARVAHNEIRHRARLVSELAPVPPVLADEGRLAHVFLNLVVNAAQAIPEGRAEQHEIRLRTHVAADGAVEITVGDTGAGMPPEVRSRLFTPFFTTKPRGTGAGLGLSIAERIVAELGGHIAVESEPGRGSTMRVRLPAAPAQARSDAQAATAATPGATRARRGRVLVVDDETMVLRMATRLLEDEHEVVALLSGAAALERVRAGERFDVILSDVMMPDVNGIDLYEALLRIAPDQAGRTVFMTGGAFTPRASAFLEGVTNPRVDKPFDAATLRAIVTQVLTRR
jgi:PAS domain S-box-containing protein